MLIPRRSFAKLASAVLGSIAIPGTVKQALAAVVPSEQTLEDAEEILRGLLRRICRAPIDEREAKLMGDFIDALPDLTYEEFARYQGVKRTADDPSLSDNDKIDRLLRDREVPIAARFITTFVRVGRGKPFFRHNFRTMHPHVVPGVINNLFGETWARYRDRWERENGRRHPSRV